MADAWMFQPSASADTHDFSPSSGSPHNSRQQSVHHAGSPPSTKAGAATKIRRRNRQINSCLECRRRKLKCDKQSPCANCTRFKRDCLFITPALDSQSQQKLADIKERMGLLEKNLESEVANKAAKAHMGGTNVTRPHGAALSYTHVENDEEDEAPNEDEESLEPTPLAALDNVYEENGDDELIDLGVQMGKMRISERIGGWIRPKLVEELNDTLQDVTGGKSRHSTSPLANDHVGVKAEQPRIQASPKSYIGPGPDYIAPASSFFFPGTNMNTNIIDYLPSKIVADQLISHYFYAVHYVARAVHRPTFEAQYEVFWNAISNGTEPVPSIQAIIFAAMFSATVSMSETHVNQQFGASKAALIDSLRSGTEMALSKANLLRTTKTQVMQAFVMYLIPLVRSEVSRAHSALVGTAIRLAECMGLHRDGSHYSLTAVEVHVRRLIWHQLCFLDMRTCEATGPRPQIRKDDYDTQFPLNVNDADLMDPNPPTEDKPYWTDMTLMRIRFETIDLRRSLWFDVVQIDKKKKSLTSVVVKVQRTKSALEERYLPMIDVNEPLQAYAKHVLTISSNGCFIQVLHRYLFSTAQKMPDRLRQLLIEAGLTQMENAIIVDTSPVLAPWAWYRGGFMQYHCALLLMVEVYAYPMRKDAAKIWKCLDYIFDIPPHLSPKQKAELVITDLRDRMEVYHQMRKLKATTQMEERVGLVNKSSTRELFGSNNSLLSPMSGQFPPAAVSNNPTNNAMPSMPPANFSPPPIVSPDSASDSRHGSMAGGGDTTMQTMEDIDWAEWDKYFPIAQNSGDLNIPNFDYTNFTGSGAYSAPGMDQSGFSASAGPSGVSAPEDLSDVNFTPAYFAPAYDSSGGYQK